MSFRAWPFGRAQAGVDEQFHERHAGAVELCFLDFLRRHFADDFVEGGFGNAVQVAAEKNFAGAHGFRAWRRAVNQIGRGFGQCLVRDARAGIFGVLLLQRLDFFARQEREEFQVADDVAVVGVDPELVEAIDAGAFRIEPDRAGLRSCRTSCRRRW